MPKSKKNVSVTDVLPNRTFPVVGVGASAGGLAAFEAFFAGMPQDGDPGMAFVLVQHLAPDHKSLLTELIRRYTRMQVFEVEDGMPVQINCTYIIPPNYDMALLGGTLQLLEPAAPRGQRLPIDYFFNTLAQDQHEGAIGVVLSGTGSDGTLGCRSIKGEGGLVLVQSPQTCEFDGMPRSAIAADLADRVLPPSEMAQALIAYSKNKQINPLRAGASAAPELDNTLKKIYLLLRNQTGHDFSLYKPSTLERRIERRMGVNQIISLELYAKYLQQTPTEVQALFNDLLIGVTSFFRDPEAFAVLEHSVIPKLLAEHSANEPIRVWVAGCSSGEEAYSIAILLQEQMDAHKTSFPVALFATDIDPRAVTAARLGIYPAGIAADLTPERLARFFTQEPGGQTYRIHKSIRDMLVFSEQNIVKDPPLSRLDLLCCRNLLIYFGAELQKKVLPLFHYALKPGGRLFLGSSEGLGEFEDRFDVIDRKAKIYQRKPHDDRAQLHPSLGRYLPTLAATVSAPLGKAGNKNTGSDLTPKQEKKSLREIIEQALLDALAPTGALVNARGDVLYLHGRTGLYLEPTPGEAGINNILKMAREGLRPALTAALHKAVNTQPPGSVQPVLVRVRTNGHFTQARLQVLALSGEPEATPLFLVMLSNVNAPQGAGAFEPAPHLPVTPAPSLDPDALETQDSPATAARIAALQQTLREKDDYLQTAQEELESSNEELKSSNEEMQSVNEELQSTNEELETSKEELQSVNEELVTVNTELLTKVADLSRANNDMNNLLAGTGIATLFVDLSLRILRFTPTASQLINLIPGDVGRPVGHIVSNLVDYGGLLADVQGVLDTLIPKEVDVQTTQARWYRLRIQPYRTLDNVIEGAVLTFVDMTENRQAAQALQEASQLMRLAVIVRDATDAITLQDLQGKTLAWNPGAVRLYGWSEEEALRLNVHDRIPPELRADAVERLLQLTRHEVLAPYLTQRLTQDSRSLKVWITATALQNEAGSVYAIATTERLCPESPP